MVEPQASRFWRAALQSGLLDAQALTACYEGIAPTKRDDAENLDRRLARQAVLSQVLTLWQAQQLMAGRTSGYKVDRYILLDMIGQGGMGRVYLARDSRLNRRVALKILSPERINNPRAIARFQREARVGAQLQHENLVRIYDFGESNGRYYLVMEFIEGRTIGSLISEGGPLPPPLAVRLVRQVALGLEHAHRKGLIHRDVNPYNIMVTHDGTAKLADLGLAIDLADEDHVTREGATVGTFDYVAPEQARHSHSADIRSDIYSLGCSLYQMLSGQVPFPGPSLPEKLFAHQTTDPKPLDEVLSSIPAGLARVVARMMRKNPDERFATPLDVAQALEPFSETGTPPGEEKSQFASDHSLQIQPLPTEATVRILPESLNAPVAANPLMSPYAPSDQGRSPAANAGLPHRAGPAPVEAVSNSDPEFSFGVDLGPEPSLSEGLQRPKARPTPSSMGSVTPISETQREANPRWIFPKITLPVWLAGPRLWALATGLVAILAVMLALGTGLVSRSGGPAEKSHPETPKKAETTQKPVLSKHAPDLVVMTDLPEEQDRKIIATTLDEAIKTAIGHRDWWIELGDDKPLKIPRDQAFNLSSGLAPLVLRAAAGCSPILEIEAGRTKPVLLTGSSVSLEINGLTIKVLGDGAPDASKSPVIQAAGRVRLRNTRMTVEGSPSKGCHAIVSDGGALDVEGCLFQGFDRALEIHTLGKTSCQVAQSMFVPSSQPPSDWFGWAVQIQTPSGATADVKTPLQLLTFEHCTFEGAGFLDMVTGTANSVVQCNVRHCAIRARALLAFSPLVKTPQPVRPVFESIRWQGVGNQLEIEEGSWIVLSADQGTPALATLPVRNLEEWVKLGPKEDQPILGKIRFQTEPASRGKSPSPSDFAVAAPPPPATRPGADPARVGPGRSR